MDLEITQSQLNLFKKVKAAYYASTKLPTSNNWQSLSSNSLWLKMVVQVIVVGGSSGGRRFWSKNELQNNISLSNLNKRKGEEQVALLIHEVLRAAGTRYCAAGPSHCQKTKALLYNYKFLKGVKGGLKAVLRELSTMESKDAELQRVHYIMQHFHFLKSKSARDYLMNLGMNTQTLAIDIRTQNIFLHFGIDFPDSRELSNEQLYREVELQIIQKICRPLHLSPLCFDRLLYQHYDKILANDFYQLKLPFS